MSGAFLFLVDSATRRIPSSVRLKSIPRVHPHVTGVNAVAGVINRPNGNRRAVGGKGNAPAAPIIRPT